MAQHTAEPPRFDDLRMGERLLWVGRPGSGGRAYLPSAGGIAFMAIWFSFMLAWVSAAFSGGSPVLFVVFALAMLGAGVKALVHPYLKANRLARTTTYAITDQRVVARSGDGSGFDLPAAGLPHAVRWSHGACSVTFGLPVQYMAPHAAMEGPPGLVQPRSAAEFRAVEDGNAMLAALERASRSLHQGPASISPPPPPPPPRPQTSWPPGPIS